MRVCRIKNVKKPAIMVVAIINSIFLINSSLITDAAMSLFSENASIALNESLISLGEKKSMKICAIIVNIIPSENCICDEVFIQIK
jgi:hypothetical protein